MALIVLNEDRKHFDSKGLWGYFFLEVNNILGSYVSQSNFIWTPFCISIFSSDFIITVLWIKRYGDVINIHHPHSVLSPKQNTNKVNESQKSIQTKYILKHVKREWKFCSFFSAQENRGTPHMLRFSKTV